MTPKQSLIDNKEEILNSLPTAELKTAFTASLEKPLAPVAAANAELFSEALERTGVTPEMINALQSDIDARSKPVVLSTP